VIRRCEADEQLKIISKSTENIGIGGDKARGFRSSSLIIIITRPPSSSSLKVTDRSFRYASPSLGIIFLPYSVNLVHHLSPPSHHPSHLPSLPLSSISDLKLTCSTNPSHHRPSTTHQTAHWTSTGLPSRTLRYVLVLTLSSFS